MGVTVSKQTDGEVPGKIYTAGTSHTDRPKDNDALDLHSEEMENNPIKRLVTFVTRLKNKPLFQCDIIPISSKKIGTNRYFCTKCSEYVEYVVNTMIHKRDVCMIFGKTSCEHDLNRCDRFKLINNAILSDKSSGVLKGNTDPWIDVFYCKSFKTETFYSACKTLRSVCVVKEKENNGLSQLLSKDIFKTSDTCYGIASFDGGFALLINVRNSYGLPPWQIQYVTKNGESKRYIYRRQGGATLLQTPTHIASNPNEDILYVSDTNRVLVLDVNGDLLKTITLDGMTPTQIVGDTEGNVYVVCGGTVIQFNSRFDKRILLENKGKSSSRNIDAIAWINPSRSLAVLKGDQLTLFKLVP